MLTTRLVNPRRAAVRAGLLVGGLAASNLVQACDFGGWGGLECSLRESRGSRSYCDGTVVMHETFYEHTDNDCHDGPARVKDCAASGHDCSDGKCVFVDLACPPGNEGVCLGGQAHACVGGRVAAAGESCGERGLRCYEVPQGAEMAAVCALEPTPCATPGTASECRGVRVVSCERGYPVGELTCDEGESCAVRPPPPADDGASPPEPPSTGVSPVAQCVLDKPCPGLETAVCDGDRIYACVDGAAAGREHDCGVYGDTCLIESGRAFCVTPGAPAPSTWRPIAGGSFAMGPSGGPTKTVTVESFSMLETEVTLRSYEACVAAQACTPRVVEGCELAFGSLDLFGDVPLTCVAYDQAVAYCAFVGGALPSEAEWEYALRNGGAEQSFPWGDEPASCELAVLSDPFGLIYWGCGRGGAWPSCSRPDGDRSAQGVCDLVGNVEEWVVRDGPAAVAGVRGGSFASEAVDALREPSPATSPAPAPERGFRCVRRR